MEHRGPLPDIDVPDIGLYELLWEGLTDADAAKVAVLDEASGVRRTFGQVKRDVDAFATWLAARGIGPGDAVAIDLPNGPDYLSAFHGIVRAGAAATPVICCCWLKAIGCPLTRSWWTARISRSTNRR